VWCGDGAVLPLLLFDGVSVSVSVSVSVPMSFSDKNDDDDDIVIAGGVSLILLSYRRSCRPIVKYLQALSSFGLIGPQTAVAVIHSACFCVVLLLLLLLLLLLFVGNDCMIIV